MVKWNPEKMASTVTHGDNFAGATIRVTRGSGGRTRKGGEIITVGSEANVLIDSATLHAREGW